MDEQVVSVGMGEPGSPHPGPLPGGEGAPAGADLAAELLAAREEAAAQRERSEAAEQRALAAYRRALLAEHQDAVIEELVQGDSEAELEASLEAARAAYQRVAEQARQRVAATHVPVGAPPRQEDPPEALSALDKIVRGLRPR